jgi:hypothetical protein
MEGEVGLLRSDEQMPGTVTRASREIYANRIPLRDPACRGLAYTADQWIGAGQAAEQQPRSHARNKRSGPGRTQHWSKQVRRHSASRSREFCNLPGRNATPEGPGR